MQRSLLPRKHIEREKEKIPKRHKQAQEREDM